LNSNGKRNAMNILVDIYANVTDDLIQLIEDNGGKVIYASKQFNSIRASVSSILVDLLSKNDDVISIATAEQAQKHKINTSEGTLDQRTTIAQSLYPNFKGANVKVGVLSDSATYLSQVQSSGDLPSVTVLDDVSGTGEGTAMLEIVYDMAPQAQLYFATAFRSDASFADNIIKLANAGCKVIVDDVFYYNEPAFEDGIIAKAVTQVSKQGVAYFSSSGNTGNKYLGTSQTWEGDYKGNNQATTFNGQKYLDFHLFASNSIYNAMTDEPNACVLQWADSYYSPTSDYDLYVVGASNNIVAASTGTSRAYEIVVIPAGSGFKLLVGRASGTPRFIRIACFGYLSLQYSTNGAIGGHAAADGGFGVGAIRANPKSFMDMTLQKQKLQPDYFSADGPRRIYYENGVAVTPGNFLSSGGKIRNKPEFLSTNGVSTATPGFSTFYGTSAAAPHAAALAALVFSVVPTMSLANLRTVLMKSTLDAATSGFDDSTGAGVLDAVLIYQNLASYLVSCTSSSCQNGGTCSIVNGQITCKCPTGYTGSTCSQKVLMCSSNPCQNGATCVEGTGSYTCKCATGYTGSTCSQKVLMCSSNPCQNGATCVEGTGSYTCKCATGYTGSTCSQKVLMCSSNPCQNGATCVEGTGSFTCKCATGYTGSTCSQKVLMCSSNPCKNGATCVEGTGSFTCKCPTGYTGSTCSQKVLMCSSNPCQNGATCVEGTGSYTCKCATGYTGSTCSQKVSMCSSNPCQNGATCVEGINSYTCTCAKGFFGSTCSQPLSIIFFFFFFFSNSS